MTKCKFFFSYARNDKSPYLDDFFEKLRDEVMHKTAVKLPNDACFRDTDNIDMGERWTEELVNALQTSHVLVCAYSQSFFSSDYCGKEVSAFLSRVSKYKEVKVDTPDVILPVLWETPSTYSVPSALTEIKYSHKADVETYTAKGLLTLSKLGRYKDEYLEFIEQLALKIQQVSQSIDLPSTKIADIRSLPNAFEFVGPKSEIGTLSLSNPNPRQTRAIFAVGVKSELQEIKKQIENYDDSGEYWKPFYPDEEEIGIILQQIASDKKLHYVPVKCADTLPDIIRDAENNNCVAILVVDPWSAKLAKYKTPLSKFDEDHFINSAVIVIWNNNDEETTQEKGDLIFNLRNSLSRCMLDNTTMVKDDIATMDDLKNSMSNAIDDARAKLLKRAKFFQTIEGGTKPMPLLSAAGVVNNDQ